MPQVLPCIHPAVPPARPWEVMVIFKGKQVGLVLQAPVLVLEHCSGEA